MTTFVVIVDAVAGRRGTDRGAARAEVPGTVSTNATNKPQGQVNQPCRAVPCRTYTTIPRPSSVPLTNPVIERISPR